MPPSLWPKQNLAVLLTLYEPLPQNEEHMLLNTWENTKEYELYSKYNS